MNRGQISPQLETTLMNDFEALNDGIWRFKKARIQDEGDFILVSVEVSKPFEMGRFATIRKRIEGLFEDMVPKREKEYSWMVVFSLEGRVVETLIGGKGVDDRRVRTKARS